MLDRTKRLIPAIALLASLLVSLPTAQSQANAKEKHTTCSTSVTASRSYTRVPYATPTYNKRYAYQVMANKYNWCGSEVKCVTTLWNNESGWRVNAHNPSGAHGIPQALPGHKMGTGWQHNPAVQINWGLKYIKNRYGTPCKALAFWNRNHWY